MCQCKLAVLVTVLVVESLFVGRAGAEDNQGKISDPAGVVPLAPAKIDFNVPSTALLPDSSVASVSGDPGGFTPVRNQTPPFKLRPPRRTPLLIGLYVSHGILQGLDAQSTFRAFHAGAHEGNPLASPFASQPGALIAFKSGVTAGTIFGIDRLYKSHPRLALITLAAINAGYTGLVTRSYIKFR